MHDEIKGTQTVFVRHHHGETDVSRTQKTDRTWRIQEGHSSIVEELRYYYFGGLFVPGPPEAWVEDRYDVATCRLPQGNHRMQAMHKYSWISLKTQKVLKLEADAELSKEKDLALNCCRLKEFLPFKTRKGEDDEAIEINGTTVKSWRRQALGPPLPASPPRRRKTKKTSPT